MSRPREIEVALDQIKAAINELDAEISRLQGDRAALSRALSHLTAGSERGQGPESAPASTGDYDGLMPQAAVMKIMRENPSRWFIPSKAARELVQLGLRPKTKTFSSQVVACFHRAEKRGFAEKAKHGKAFAFRWKAATGNQGR